MEKKNELLIRVYFIFFVFVALALTIIAKVVKTSLVDGEKWRAQGQKNIKWIEVEGERGNIYDAKGNLLATSLPYFDIKVDLLPTDKNVYFEENIDALSEKLAQHFGKTASAWKTELTKVRNQGKAGRNSKARYFPLLYRVTQQELELLKTFPLFNLGKYKGGLLWERELRREHPYQELAQRTIGMNKKDNDKVGLEGAFDNVLSGDSEKRLMRRLPGDIWLPVFEPSEMVQEKGCDVVTTLDMHIQDIAHDELLSCLHKNDAEKGSVVVMDVKTGAIKAMVNLQSSGVGQYEEMWNDAVGTKSEPGSTFKLVSALAMMEHGCVEPSSKVNLFGGKKQFHDLTMYDSERHGTTEATFEDAFAMSSNVGVGYAAYKCFGRNRDGWKEFHSVLKEMSALSLTGVEINGEVKPYIKDPNKFLKDSPKNWEGTTVPWMAHGYELEMTPLQILNYYNTVANDGRMMRPYLVSEVIDAKGVSRKIKPKTINEQICGPKTILYAQQLLKAVAERGTARNLKVDGLSFAGKTGTTKIYWDNSERKKYNASFAGYFPEENPKYSVIVVVYDPAGLDYYGAKVAGPVFQNIMKRISGYEGRVRSNSQSEELGPTMVSSGHKEDFKKVMAYIDIPYAETGMGNWVKAKPQEGRVMLQSKRIKRGMIPDVRGKGLRDALYILENIGVKVVAEGFGKVHKQSLKPGTSIQDDIMKIYLK